MSLCDYCGGEEEETFTCKSCGSECCIECGDSKDRECAQCDKESIE